MKTFSIILFIALAAFCVLSCTYLTARFIRRKKERYGMTFEINDDSYGIPIVHMKYGDEMLNLVVDTGATESLLREDIVKKEIIAKKPKILETFTFYTADGTKHDTYKFDVGLTYGDDLFVRRFGSHDFSNAHDTDGPGIDGLIGNDFLNIGYIIDYKRKMIYKE